MLALLAVLVVTPQASAWSWPLRGEVLRPYSLGPDPYAAGQHRGVDVAGSAGEAVRAPAAGVVSFVGVVPSSGRTVTIQTDGYAVSLTHLGETTVAKGATVAEGDAVGVAGQSGEVEWPTPYVHLGIRVSSAADGYIDPATLLPPRAVAPPPPPAGEAPAPRTAPAPVAPPVTSPVPAPVTPPSARRLRRARRSARAPRPPPHPRPSLRVSPRRPRAATAVDGCADGARPARVGQRLAQRRARRHAACRQQPGRARGVTGRQAGSVSTAGAVGSHARAGAARCRRRAVRVVTEGTGVNGAASTSACRGDGRRARLDRRGRPFTARTSSALLRRRAPRARPPFAQQPTDAAASERLRAARS